jgi:ribosomal protein S18 acetylase RimI-like enzyme
VDFIEMTATRFLREAFRADLVAIWHVDLANLRGSHCLGDLPVPPEAFHDYAIHHPVVGKVRHAGALTPAQGHDEGSRERSAPRGGYCLAIPLALDDSHVRLVAIGRPEPEFSPAELILAGRLQQVLAGVWTAKPGPVPGGE